MQVNGQGRTRKLNTMPQVNLHHAAHSFLLEAPDAGAQGGYESARMMGGSSCRRTPCRRCSHSGPAHRRCAGAGRRGAAPACQHRSPLPAGAAPEQERGRQRGQGDSTWGKGPAAAGAAPRGALLLPRGGVPSNLMMPSVHARGATTSKPGSELPSVAASSRRRPPCRPNHNHPQTSPWRRPRAPGKAPGGRVEPERPLPRLPASNVRSNRSTERHRRRLSPLQRAACGRIDFCHCRRPRGAAHAWRALRSKQAPGGCWQTGACVHPSEVPTDATICKRSAQLNGATTAPPWGGSAAARQHACNAAPTCRRSVATQQTDLQQRARLRRRDGQHCFLPLCCAAARPAQPATHVGFGRSPTTLHDSARSQDSGTHT